LETTGASDHSTTLMSCLMVAVSCEAVAAGAIWLGRYFFFRKDGKSFAEFLLEGEKRLYNTKTPNSKQHHITPHSKTDSTRNRRTTHHSEKTSKTKEKENH